VSHAENLQDKKQPNEGATGRVGSPTAVAEANHDLKGEAVFKGLAGWEKAGRMRST